MKWVYAGAHIGMDPETFYFMRVVNGGTTAEYEEWLMAAIETGRLTMSLEEEREREILGSPAPIRQAEKG